MSRRCACSRLLEIVQSDPRLLVLPLAVSGLFVRLAGLAARMEAPGVFRIGGNPLGFDQVSLLVSCRETEVETWVENLVQVGLLARDAADGALLMPMAVGAEARDQARKSRENGRLGGRPRRGETPAAARERRQGSMLLPIAGGVSEKPAQTQPETLAGARLASQPASISEAGSSSQPASRAADALVREVGEELAAIAGFDPARDAYSLHDVRAWLDAGATRELLVDVIGGIAGRSSYQKPQRYWRYFDPAVRQAIADWRPVAANAPAVRDPAVVAWEKDRADWEANGRRGSPPPPPMRRVA